MAKYERALRTVMITARAACRARACASRTGERGWNALVHLHGVSMVHAI